MSVSAMRRTGSAFGLAGAYLEAGQAESASMVSGDDPAQA